MPPSAPASSQEMPPDQPMVCGRPIQGDLAYIPKDEHAGKVLYFCTEYCLRAYQADPLRFYPAHSRTRTSGVNRVESDPL